LNNICELFNKQLVGARDKPIITCLEYIREYLKRRIGKVTEIQSYGGVQMTHFLNHRDANTLCFQTGLQSDFGCKPRGCNFHLTHNFIIIQNKIKHYFTLCNCKVKFLIIPFQFFDVSGHKPCIRRHEVNNKNYNLFMYVHSSLSGPKFAHPHTPFAEFNLNQSNLPFLL